MRAASRRGVGLIVATVAAALAGCELLVDVPRPDVVGDAGASVDDGGAGGGDGPAATCAPDCAGPTPYCDLASTTCVECLEASHCPGERPACQAGTCQGCLDDTTCGPSGVCLLDGSCAAPARIRHAAPAGVGAACTVDQPCALDVAVAGLDAVTDVVRLLPGDYPRVGTLAPTAPGLIAGAGATLRAQSGGGLFAVVMADAVAVSVTGLVVDAAGHIGVQSMNGGALRLHRATVQGGLLGGYAGASTLELVRTRVTANTGYGVFGSGAIVRIENAVIDRNGSTGGFLAGLTLSDGSTGVVEHSTIAANSASDGAGGLRCAGSPGVVIRSNVLWGNSGGGIEASCVVTFGVVDPGYPGAGTAGTQAIDPLFVDASAGDFHLQATSPARGLADPASIVATDLDGEARPRPAPGPSDAGADEVP